MIKDAEPSCYMAPLHSVSIWNVGFSPLLVAFICVCAVTTSLLITEVIKTCGSHVRQIVLLGRDILG